MSDPADRPKSKVLLVEDTGLFTVPGFGPIADYNAGDLTPSVFFLDGTPVAIDYDHGPMNNQVALVVVPEPGTALSLAGAAGLMLGLQRFRRRRS